MNQNFSRSKNLHESSKLEHFQWGGGGGGRGIFECTNLGVGKNFGPHQRLDFQQLSHFQHFELGVKN